MSTGNDRRGADPKGTREGRSVEPPSALRYAIALAEARSYLAALADTSPVEQSIAYEHLLLELDAMNGGRVPATFSIAGSLLELNRRLEARLEDLGDLGGDTLSIELILTQLDEIRSAEQGPPK